MRFSQKRARALIGCDYRILLVCGICAILLAAGVDAYGSVTSSEPSAEIAAAEKNTRQKRIKRLKLADPESTEVMLA